MSDNYFDDIGTAIEDDDDDDRFDDFGNDDDDDDDEVELVFDDGIKSKDDIEFQTFKTDDGDEVIVEEVVEERPPKKEKPKKEKPKKEKPKKVPEIDDSYDDYDSYDDNDFDKGYDERDDLSLSDMQKKKKHRKKNGKILAIFLILAVTFAAIAFLVTYTIFQRDTAPSIRTVHIESDNAEDPTVARYGNMITLSFTFNKALEGLPVVIIRGKEVEVFGSGDTYNAMYFVQEQGDQDELVSFTIRDYMDSFKKVGNPVTATSDGSKVVILKYE